MDKLRHDVRYGVVKSWPARGSAPPRHRPALDDERRLAQLPLSGTRLASAAASTPRHRAIESGVEYFSPARVAVRPGRGAVGIAGNWRLR